jgi:hypothetical protein
MDKKQGIKQLFAAGMAKRKIVRTLGINRKSVDRHLTELQSKGGNSGKAPTGKAPTGSEDSKGAKALTGFAPMADTSAAFRNLNRFAGPRHQFLYWYW